MHIARAWKVAAASLVGLTALAALGLVWWLPSDADLARRVEAEVAQRSGIQLKVGALHWSLLPRPQLVLHDLVTQQRERAIEVNRLTLALRTSALLSGRLELDSAALDGAVVASRSVRELGQLSRAAADADQRDDPAPAAASKALAPPSHIEFRHLTWISRSGVAVLYEGEAEIQVEAGVLQSAHVRRPGFEPTTDLRITREAGTDDDAPRWALQARVGGGTADGHAALRRSVDGGVELTGELAPKAVEIQSALAAFNRRSPVAGRATGRTTLRAKADTAQGLVQVLHTTTEFTMQPATVLRFDLDRAIQTLGREHQGQTQLDSLTGRVDTQNTPDGTVFRFTDLKAQSGALTASGDATLHNRYLKATAAVDLVDGVIGIPLGIEGPTQALKVTVKSGAAAGAIAGTAVLPGIGTVIGAALGRVFGGPEEDRARPATKPAPTPR